ncbi:MAG: phosphatidate cytidylyltransferase [Cyanothece sp. SIO1E1]|nr:phosphatidate cytidylyltransferase [Cyanothece sp. SIO1E1]
MAIGTGVAVALGIIISILYRDDSATVKALWLKTLILIGLVLVLIGAGGLGKWGFLPVALFMAYFGWLEFLQCVEIKYGAIALPGLIRLLGTVGILGALWGTALTTYLGVVIAAWGAIALPLWLTRNPPPMYGMLSAAFGTLFITMPLALLLALSDSAYGEFSLLILLVITNDAAAQLLGQIAGRTPLIPQISPSKTAEGALGGLIFCLIWGYIFRFLVPGWQLWQILLVAGGISVMALSGDLIASALKREANIKDFGHILATTGGILDKFDSLMFTVPIFYVTATWIDYFGVG